jgi:spore germination cell wall hydrolase CwlJ-like protein
MWMAKNIYFEAGNQSLAGMLAVGLVVKNRIIDGRYANSVKGVVTQGKRDDKGNIISKQCQFSWYCDGRPEKILDIAKWERALFLAKTILMGKIFDFTDGALFFHNVSVAPNWKLKKIGSIGNHIFYKKT